jgi:hypothetical protein
VAGLNVCLARYKQNPFRALARWGLVVVCLGISLGPALAQAGHGNVGGLFGSLVQAGARANAQKAWAALPPPMHFCMEQGLAIKGQSLNNTVNQGMSPSDNRLASLRDECTALTSRALRANVECTINEAGTPVNTRCNEAYVEFFGSQTRGLTAEQYIMQALRGAQVTITMVETSEAHQARAALAQQQQQAATEQRQKEEQAAAEAQRKQQEAAMEAARKQQETELAKAEKQQAATQEVLSKRDLAIAARRKTCVAVNAQAFGGSDHDALTLLLNTNTPPLQAYQSVLAQLANSSEKPQLLSALRDRIEFDAKRWGTVVSHSGSGDYSWETLKRALALLGDS